MPKNEYLESRIAVLETKWFEHKNTSVRGTFDLLSDLRYGHHHGYRYEMFGGSEEFKKSFDRLAEKNGIHYIYIAAHGDEEALQGSMGERIKIGDLKRRISSAELDDARGKLAGLYFGSCSFGQPETLKKLLAQGNKLRWIAGYEKNVDFVESTAFDLLFFDTLLHYRHDKKCTELDAIKNTADVIKLKVGGLADSLGFSLMLWERECLFKLI